MAINSFASLLDKDIATSPWYIGGNILPKGGTLLFGGHSKIGKSFLALNMAKNLALGELLYGCPFIQCNEAKVLLVEQEIGERGLQNRGSRLFYKARNGWQDNFFYLTKESKLQLNTPQGVNVLSEAIGTIKPNVLILDPIGKMHGFNENSNDEIGELFNIFDRLKKINPVEEMAVVVSHHFKKPPDGQFKRDYDPLDPHNFRGAVRWFSDPDTIITANREGEIDREWEAWNIRMRFNLRQDESPDDVIVSFNRDPLEQDVKEGNLKVNYEYSIGSNGHVFKNKPAPKTEVNVKKPKQENLFVIRK